MRTGDEHMATAAHAVNGAPDIRHCTARVGPAARAATPRGYIFCLSSFPSLHGAGINNTGTMPYSHPVQHNNKGLGGRYAAGRRKPSLGYAARHSTPQIGDGVSRVGMCLDPYTFTSTTSPKELVNGGR
jgi:hypothetical protein